MAIQVNCGNTRLVPTGGIALVGNYLNNAGFVSYFNRQRQDRRVQKYIGNGDLFATYIGMLDMASPEYDAVADLEDDPDFYIEALGLEKGIPSAEILRQRFNETGDSCREDILQQNLQVLLKNGCSPHHLSPELDFVPVDIDVSPMDNSKTKKEGVSRTYKGFDGYAPIFAYIGREGYAVNAELRIGKQHSQSHTPVFLLETIRLCKQFTNKPLLFRLDSGNDAQENIGIFLEAGCYFIIKRNLRREDRHEWYEKIKDTCPSVTKVREGKEVYVGTTYKTVTYTDSEGNEKTQDIRIVYEITRRTIDKYGQMLMPEDIEVDMWWDNTGLPDEKVIELYHKHGEMEQFHSEIKSDMGVERLPSGKFATNQLILELSLVAYNILRIIGTSGPTASADSKVNTRRARRRRARTIIQYIIMAPAVITRHARYLCMNLGQSNPWRDVFCELWASSSCGLI